jgi:hypothetical protein
MKGINWLLIVIALPALLGACGAFVPEKTFLADEPDPNNGLKSAQASYENDIVSHIVCEVAAGLAQAQGQWQLPWLPKWGTAITLTISAQEQGGLSPGVSTLRTLPNVIKMFPTGGNVVSPQQFSLGVGVSAAGTATRTETIQYTYANQDLLRFARQAGDCAETKHGIMIDSDLKIRQFIYDKAQVARLGNANLAGGTSPLAWQWPIYNTFTEEISFLTGFGGNITPTWKLARFTANTNSNLASAERTYTNDLIITIGPLGSPSSPTQAAALGPAGQAQHNAKVNASAIATSISALPH